MKLQVQRDFYKVANEFKSGQYDIDIVSRIIVLVREYREELTVEAAKALLEIPINVLEKDVELINDKTWALDNSSYFYGNITWMDSTFQEKWRTKFASGSYTLEDIAELCRIISSNFDIYRSASEFLLRNVEVTLRDDVRLYKYSNFNDSGFVFYKKIVEAINLI